MLEVSSQVRADGGTGRAGQREDRGSGGGPGQRMWGRRWSWASGTTPWFSLSWSWCHSGTLGFLYITTKDT